MVHRPRIGISACLLGQEVRYDGGHKLHPWFTSSWTPWVEWVPICPEVESGMPVPRPPIQLVQGKKTDEVRVQEVAAPHADHTDELLSGCQTCLARIRQAAVQGMILKSKSPSCGLQVPLFSAGDGITPVDAIPGFFVSRLRHAFPDLPVIDENMIYHSDRLRHFLETIASQCDDKSFRSDAIPALLASLPRSG